MIPSTYLISKGYIYLQDKFTSRPQYLYDDRYKFNIMHNFLSKLIIFKIKVNEHMFKIVSRYIKIPHIILYDTSQTISKFEFYVFLWRKLVVCIYVWEFQN